MVKCMQKILLIDDYPLVFDILEEYHALEENGIDNKTACSMLRQRYWQELEDTDDGDIVWIALAIAQAGSSASDETLRQKALYAIENRLHDDELPAELARAFKQAAKLVNRADNAHRKEHRKARSYRPEWRVGDTFAHLLSHPLTSRAELEGWYVLFRKTGEYTDVKQKTHQLGYLSLCPPEKLPHKKEELEALGYLRVMPAGSASWEYLVQIEIQSKKAERELQFEYLGSFPDAAKPPDEVLRKPEVSMPFFTGIDKQTGCPSYEDHICRIFTRNGASSRQQ